MGDEGETNNEQSGTVNGPVAQVGAVYGGVHFGGQHQEPVVPRQLPQAVAPFAGQADELAALHAVLADSARAVVISAVEGATGIGKTALAVHWANQVADRFPGGQLYADLRGSDPSGWPARPGDVLRSFLEALGEDRIPSDVAAQAARYRTLLADKRVLVVLDDVRDAEQVRPLLPGGSNSFIVLTSRNPLTGLIVEGARSLMLDVLSAGEARELLVRRLGEDRLAAEPQAADELIELCGRLPQALSVVAASAASVPFSALAAELRNAVGPPGVGNLSARMAAVLDWARARTAPPPVDGDWRSRVRTPVWLRSPKVLFAAAAAVAAATLFVSTPMIAASSFLGLGYFLIRFALLFAGLVLMERPGGRGAIGTGLVVANAVYCLVDALASIHAEADVWVWLEFFFVIAFTVMLVMRLASFDVLPRRARIVPPTRRPLAYVVVGAAAAQFILLFAGIPHEYGSMTVLAGVGALAALLPVVAIGGLCAATALTEPGDESQRAFVAATVAAYLGPELLLLLGSLLLGPRFTYLGNAFWSDGAYQGSWGTFAVAQAVAAAALLASTWVLLRRAAEQA
ncbi:NB-ARC domain-containing protein [Saccharopolyspora pogona]|uniref:NB-ARC domain-containing protein n=1 Tax=Saccharopolyspora pogona TaxID=333966 RepID=UPI001CC26FE0|nr:NB-ARC domain-containing protein [Saccharopolyspora pogona]